MSREAVRDSHLRGMTDIQRLSRKLASHKISLQELCQLYMASMQLPALVDALTEHQGVPATSGMSRTLLCLVCAWGGGGPWVSVQIIEVRGERMRRRR